MIQEERLLRAIVDALTQDRLTLPTLPEVAMRIGRVAQDENVTASKLAVEIGRDAAIAVRLLRVANSSAFSAGRRIDNLQQAVTRLGIGLVRSLVTGLALEQSLQLQRSGLGAGRKFGCGLFIPHKDIADLRSRSD